MIAGAVKAAFAAATTETATVLLLGSLPGERSLAAGQYYANPNNHFWRLIGGVIGEDLYALDYPGRIECLLAAGIGLWDVIGSARRKGSLDSDIRDPLPNDLRAIVAGLPALRVVAFNGGKASAIGRRQLSADTKIDLVDLPSSSAAYCSISFDAKQARWLALRDYLRERDA